MRKSLLAVPAVASLALAALSAQPADAQSVTFTLTGSVLAIAEPSAPAALTGGALAGLTGNQISGPLGTTVVTDQRGGVLGWSSKIAGDANGFNNAVGTTPATTTIPASAASAWVPTTALTTTGVSVVTAGTHVTQATGLPLSTTAQNLVTATGVVGNNTATFTPSIAITIPSNATAGDYSGIVTQTVG